MRILAVTAVCVLLAAMPVSAQEPQTRAQRVGKANQLYEEGRKLVEQGDFAGANDRFSRAQQLLEQGAPQGGQPVAAVQQRVPAQYDREKVQRADLLYNEAVAAIRHEEFKKAQSCLEQAVELNPKDKDAYYNLGIIYERYLKDKGEAVKCYVRYVLLETDPGKAGAVRQWLSELKKGAVK
ncbi:MAG: tetratricopeptide repeat protein [Deltaproteobacteria bacterium]